MDWMENTVLHESYAISSNWEVGGTHHMSATRLFVQLRPNPCVRPTTTDQQLEWYEHRLEDIGRGGQNVDMSWICKYWDLIHLPSNTQVICRVTCLNPLPFTTPSCLCTRAELARVSLTKAAKPCPLNAPYGLTCYTCHLPRPGLCLGVDGGLAEFWGTGCVTRVST